MDDVISPIRILSIGSLMKGSKNKIHDVCVGAILALVAVSVIIRQILKPINDNMGIIIGSVQYANYNLRWPTIACCLIMTNRKSDSIDCFINTVIRLEKTFKSMGFTTDYKGIKWLTRELMVFVALKVVVQQIPFYLKDRQWSLVSYCDYVVYNIPIFFIHILLSQWVTYLTILRHNFKTLNTVLKTLRHRQCWVVEDFRILQNSLKTIPQREILRNCALIYDDLCVQGEQLNGAFAWQFLFFIPTVFVITIFNSFQTCRMIKNQIDFDCGWVIFDVLYFALFFELVVPCIWVSEEIDKFVDSLHKVESSENEDVVNAMILQTHHQKIEFSARGVFPLNGTLIYSILGALTTYLVILLQFDL